MADTWIGPLGDNNTGYLVLSDTDGKRELGWAYERTGTPIPITSSGGLDVADIAISTLPADSISATHIDFGTADGEVCAAVIPIADAGDYFTTDDIESALTQLSLSTASPDAASLPIADAGSKYTATNVEDALAEVKTLADAASPAASPTFTGIVTLPAAGLIGTDYGGTGAPGSGAHVLGEIVMDSAANIFVCAVAGTPGTWKQVTLI